MSCNTGCGTGQLTGFVPPRGSGLRGFLAAGSRSSYPRVGYNGGMSGMAGDPAPVAFPDPAQTANDMSYAWGPQWPAGSPRLVGDDDSYGRYEDAIRAATGGPLESGIKNFESLPSYARAWDAAKWDEQIGGMLKSQAQIVSKWATMIEYRAGVLKQMAAQPMTKEQAETFAAGVEKESALAAKFLELQKSLQGKIEVLAKQYEGLKPGWFVSLLSKVYVALAYAWDGVLKATKEILQRVGAVIGDALDAIPSLLPSWLKWAALAAGVLAVGYVGWRVTRR
jgi:hypothetical protein